MYNRFPSHPQGRRQKEKSRVEAKGGALDKPGCYHWTGQPRFLSNHDIRNLTGQLLITSVIKSRRLQWAGHVVQARKKREIYKAPYGRAVGRRPNGR